LGFGGDKRDTGAEGFGLPPPRRSEKSRKEDVMKTFFRMTATDDVGEITIFDEIGYDSYSIFNTQLEALGPVKNINLRINSPGGNVFDGLAIYNTLKNHAATVTARVEGIAASAASLIAMAADKIVMPENSFMLIHEPSGLTYGTADDHASMAADLQKMADKFAGIYAGRTRSSLAAVKALMKQDCLMTAGEAKAAGYCDEVAGGARMVATFDPAKLPAKAMAAFNSGVGLSNVSALDEWKKLQSIVKAEMGIGIGK
jgi:ATP-dependent Clp protease protease subunit